MMIDKVVSIDPGGTNGVCVFEVSRNGVRGLSSVDRFQCDQAGLFDFLERTHSVDVFVVEEWRFRRGKTGGGDKMVSSQNIGAIKYAARCLGSEYIEVSTEAHIMGQYLSGEAQPKDHKLSHEVDAYNLGVWWLVEEDYIDAPSLTQLTEEMYD